VPVLIENHDRSSFRQVGQVIHDFIGLFCHVLVEVLTRFVVAVDAVALFQCRSKILFNQQVDRFLSVLYSSRSIDAGTYLEYDVAHRNFFFSQSAYINNGFQSDAGVGIELTQSVIGQNTVFTHNRYNVGCDADRYQIEQGGKLMKLDAVVLGKGLHKLESYSAARQVFVWIRRIRTLGIQNGGSRRKYLIGHMMVADNEIDAFFFGVTDFFYRFNTTVQYDDQFYSGRVSIVDSLF